MPSNAFSDRLKLSVVYLLNVPYNCEKSGPEKGAAIHAQIMEILIAKRVNALEICNTKKGQVFLVLAVGQPDNLVVLLRNGALGEDTTKKIESKKSKHVLLILW